MSNYNDDDDVSLSINKKNSTLDLSLIHINKCIIHIDIDCFYAQVEMILNPTLSNKPLGIKQKNLLVTCNYIAREMGVKKCSTVNEAKKICPEIILVNGEDLTKYRDMSMKITKILQESFTNQVQRLGFDENFLDVTNLVERKINTLDDIDSKIDDLQPIGHVYEKIRPCQCNCHQKLIIATQIAAEIRLKLADSLKITCCAGIAHNKLLAKLISGQHKPNQQTVIFPTSVCTFLRSLSNIKLIPGVGNSTFEKLKQVGIITINDVLARPIEDVCKIIGKESGRWLRNCCLGIDDSTVKPFTVVNSMSDEDSFVNCCTLIDATDHLKRLLWNLIDRLLNDGRWPKTIRLSIRYDGDNKRFSKQCNITPGKVSIKLHDKQSVFDKLFIDVDQLFKKIIVSNKNFKLTLISITLTNFEKDLDTTKNNIKRYFNRKRSISPPLSLNDDDDDIEVVNVIDSTKRNSKRTIKDFFIGI